MTVDGSIPITGFLRARLIAWTLYLALIPLYILPSGLPQPADVVMVLLIGSTAAVYVQKRNDGVIGADTRVISALGLFVAYVTLVNWIWMMVYGDRWLLVTPIFYLFNGAVFLVAYLLYVDAKVAFLKSTLLGLSLAVGSLLLTAPWLIDPISARQSLMFNNPNQLGYFGILSAIILHVVSSRVGVHSWLQDLSVAGCAALVILSLSKSAIVAMVLFVIIRLPSRPRGTLALVLVGVIVVATTGLQGNIADVTERLSGIGVDMDDSFAGRGYDRILYHPGHLLFGAGEGAFGRFRSDLAGEIHSTTGTLLFSYGIVGSCLFLLFILATVSGCRLSTLMLLLPVLFYSFTHHGMRFTLFWVLLAVVGVSGKALRGGA